MPINEAPALIQRWRAVAVKALADRDDARAALERANDALAAQRETAKRFVAAVHHAGECVLAAVTSYEDDSRG